MTSIVTESGPSTTSIVPVTVSKRRRVPDALRQRVEISCDRCKTRKRRCIRKDNQTDCAACLESQSECRSTLPRKRRQVPSQYEARYTLLESIVRKLHPEADLDSGEGLRSLAKRIGVDDTGGIPAGEEDGDDKDGDGDDGNYQGKGLQFLASELPEGWLVDAPRGGSHYVGPASLVFFARCARELVAKSNMFNQPAYDEAGLRRYLQATEFTTYKTSHTIEANIQGHPATFAAQSDPSPSGSLPDHRLASPGALHLPRGMGRETADQLVNAYFDRVNINFPVLHRGAFSMQHQRSFGQNSLRSDPGWTCTLAMVYTLGAQALEQSLPTAQSIQQEYLSIVVREGLGRLIIGSTLANVQALLLLALYQHNAGERNTAWILIGQALRSAVALGLHRDGENAHLDPFERNIRRTVWWQLHMFEQLVSLALGRPSFSDAINVNAKVPESSYETGIGLPEAYLEHATLLSQFIVRIKQAVGTLSVVYEEADRLIEYLPAVMAIHSELIAWKKSCPPSLRLYSSFQHPSQRRAVFMLSIWADYLESVLCRPYLLCRVSQELRKLPRNDQIDEVAALSVSAAQACSTKLLMLAEHGLLEGSVWLDFYCAQHSIMVTSLHFLGQPDPPDGAEMKDCIGKLIDTVRQTALAPTFRITMNVALQLACIAGIGPNMLVQVPELPAASPHVQPLPPPVVQEPVMDTTFASLEHLLGPMPPSAYNSEPNIFADHVNFGFNENDPWDFFNLGSIQQARQGDGM